MLESALKEQLKGIFAGLEANFTFDISVSSSHENKTELLELLGDVADCSDHITCVVNEGNALKFTLLKNGDRIGITFRGIPNGHEFTSLLLAILNLDGKGKNFPDEAVCNRVKALKGPIHLTTYVSLTCTNCPDVVPVSYTHLDVYKRQIVCIGKCSCIFTFLQLNVFLEIIACLRIVFPVESDIPYLDRKIRGQRRIIERIAQLSASGIRHQPQSGIQPLRDK